MDASHKQIKKENIAVKNQASPKKASPINPTGRTIYLK